MSHTPSQPPCQEQPPSWSPKAKELSSTALGEAIARVRAARGSRDTPWNKKGAETTPHLGPAVLHAALRCGRQEATQQPASSCVKHVGQTTRGLKHTPKLSTAVDSIPESTADFRGKLSLSLQTQRHRRGQKVPQRWWGHKRGGDPSRDTALDITWH